MTIYPSPAYVKLFEETDIPDGAPSDVTFAYKVFNFTRYQLISIK